MKQPQKKPAVKRNREWSDSDRFWIDLYPYMFPPSRFEQAGIIVEKTIALAAPGGRAVLDLCCGPGRCSVELANHGFAVTGVDSIRFMLDKARLAAKKAKARVRWVQADMRDFVCEETFDLILNMYTSFGYFENKNDDISVLGNMYASLKKNGVLVMEMKSKEGICRNFRPTTSSVHADGTVFVERHRLVDHCTRLENEWILIRNGRAKTYTFSHTIYSAQEITDRLQGAGFGTIKIYGDFDGAEFGINSPRLIVVANK